MTAVDSGGMRIAISACLLGQPVRWDGGHKHDVALVEALSRHATLVAVCPELEIGLGVPREPIRLERAGGAVRLRGLASGIDHSPAMADHAARRIGELAAMAVSGYVFKAGSPSCGLWRVAVHRTAGGAVRDGRGLFAAALCAALPALPVAEEGELHDADALQRFLARVRAYRSAGAAVRGLDSGRDPV